MIDAMAMLIASMAKKIRKRAGAMRLPIVVADAMLITWLLNLLVKGIKMAWLWLIIGGLFEIGFTTSLRFVDGFRNGPWTLAFLGSVTISMGLLEQASRTIPMGTAYAVWGGIGAVGTVAVGMALFGEPVSSVRLMLIAVIVGAIVALRITA